MEVLTLLAIGLAAGMVVGISPCVLPVLPVIFTAGSAEGSKGQGGARRSLAVVAGLVVSFVGLEVVLRAVLSALHIPGQVITDLGVVILVVFALSLLFPKLGELVERPFARLSFGKGAGSGTPPFLLGLALGTLFLPCAAPALAALSIVGIRQSYSGGAIGLSIGFAVGIAIPLSIIALSGERLTARVRWFQHHAEGVRRGSGAFLLAMAVVFAAGWTTSIESDAPSWLTNLTNTLQRDIAGSASARAALDSVEQVSGGPGNLGGCQPTPKLINCGRAPAIEGILSWLNTPGDRPVKLASLRGKVALVDFWTYSCINCQRTLPHIKAWYARYHDAGFEVIGDHYPEFYFEAQRSNVAKAVKELGITYPVALDSNGTTWTNYGVQYWPTEVLIDATGTVVHISIGEGDYDTTERLIREALELAHPGRRLPAPTNVHAVVASSQSLTPEIHFGANWSDPNLANAMQPFEQLRYTLPNPLPQNEVGISGQWLQQEENLTAKGTSQVTLNYEAKDVYLVCGGHGTLTVHHADGSTSVLSVSGYPKLRTLEARSTWGVGTVTFDASPGVQLYSFTFG